MTYKILIVAPAWVGDVIMAQTLFKTLKIYQPDCLIDVLAPDWAIPILQHMPEVRNSFILPLKHGELNLTKRWTIGKKLYQAHYDQAILLPNSFKSALIPFWANIKKRTGWLGEMRFWLLNDYRYLDKKALPLMIQRFAALGLPKNNSLPNTLPYPLLEVDSNQVKDTIARLNIPLETEKKPILALCPGAEYGPAKRWPTRYYAAVANQKIADGWSVWVLGSMKDQPIAQEIQTLTQNKVFNFTGRTGLGEAINLLSLANVIVSNDSGLMHIGAALSKPIVVIYGSSDPRFTPPLTDKKKILTLNLPCSPCFERTCPLEHLKCLEDLHPKQVIEAIEYFFSES
jgi:heptosyltransferase II